LREKRRKRSWLRFFGLTYTLPLKNGSFLIKISDVQKLKMAIYKGLVILKVAKIPQNQASKLLDFLIFSCLTERFRGIPEGRSETIENKGFNKVLFSPARSFSGHSPSLINILISIFLFDQVKKISPFIGQFITISIIFYYSQ